MLFLTGVCYFHILQLVISKRKICSRLNASSFGKYITISNILGIITMSKSNTHKCDFCSLFLC